MLKSKVFLAILSGVLLSLSWPTYGFPYLIFFAFIPLLYIEDQVREVGVKPLRKVFLYSYIAIFIWNIITTWWIWNSTEFGAIMAIVLNTLFMSLIWVAFSWSKNHFKYNKNAIFILPIYWIGFEYFHLDWDLSWSWLNLGNVFAMHPYAIQWYEYTGTLGGSWWILVINILLFLLVKKVQIKDFRRKKLLFPSLATLLVFLMPLIYSWQVYSNFQDRGKQVEIVVVQPNMDPWSEQFLSPPEDVINRIIKLSSPLISPKTQFLIAPESAIQEGIQEHPLPYSDLWTNRGVSVSMLQDFMKQYPDMQLIIGGSSYRFLQEPTSTSRTTESGYIYDEYNTAILMNSQGVEDVYHKSKLVPGPEKMPFKKLLSPIQSVAFDLGGTVGSLGYDERRKVFYSKKDSIAIAPLICYESIYGGFVAEFVRNGAQILVIITNDGWWGNSQGHQQHLAYARLRAIECRRSIARSANTGISGFINQRGDLIDNSSYWVSDAKVANVSANNEITFFTRYGDYPGRVSAFLAVLLLLISVTVSLKKDQPHDESAKK
ncbi:MAG: apolipoprotein N-acyltransferase [Bacteroidales bacterium]|nr:apolipoprotein N-acyltransferase [Bacteroidales bacterium]